MRRGDAGDACAGGDDYPDPIKPALFHSRHPRRRAVWEPCEVSSPFGGLGYRADNPLTGMRHVQLSSGWSLSCAEGGRILPACAASLPGNVHLDLLRAGLIQDPRVGMGVLTSRWVRTCGWVYETAFDAPEEALAPATRRAWLVFDEISGSAEIALNDELVAKHDGGTRPCHVDVSGKLRAGMNRLRVHVEASKQLMIGLTGAVRLEWTHLPVRVDLLVPATMLSEDLSAGRVHVRQFLEVLSDQPVKVSLLAQLPEAGVLSEVHAELRPGPGVVEATVDVPSPKVWHLAGQGAQNLYTLMTTVVAHGHDVGRQTTAIGFRHVAVDDSAAALARVSTAADGAPRVPPFPFVRINGQRAFLKVATVLPPDLLEADARDRWKSLVSTAGDLHLDGLVVSADAACGRGVDALYELADRAGLVLFQELPEGEGAEAVVRRLTGRPSLIAWCGAEGGDPTRPSLPPIEARAITPGPAAPATIRACMANVPQASSAFVAALQDTTDVTGGTPVPHDNCRAAVLQGEALCAFIEAARRQAPAVAGLHLHRLNDARPATRTRALMDHGLRRTAAWDYARRALRPVHVTIAVDGDQVEIVGLNDTPRPVVGDLRFGVVQLDGMFLINRSVRVQLAPQACTRLVTFPLARWRDRHKSIAFATFSRMTRTLARNCLAVTPPDQMRWPTPVRDAAAAVQTQLIAQQVTFTSPTFARGVCLDDTGEERLADNFFDLYPGIPHTIPWTLPRVPRVLHVANG